jgi:hypothetical protein
MARVNVGGIIYDLDRSIKSALHKAVQKALPDAVVDRDALFREFTNAVRNECKDWEQVLDRNVQAD